MREGMMRRTATRVLAAMLIVPAMFLGACSEPLPETEAVPETAAASGPVTIRMETGNYGAPSPFAHYPRARGTVMKYLFDSLVEIGENGYIPWLAEEWDVSEDGLTHTVTLREGVTWHDGEPLTTDDVVFSFEYYQKHPPVFVAESIQDPESLVEIEALSTRQVRFTTAEPLSTFYSEAGTMRIIPKHIWEGVEDPYTFLEAEAYVGCGPYTLAEYDPDKYLYRYEAFDEFWGPQPLIDVLELVPVSDTALALQAGDIDIAHIPADTLDQFEDNDEFEVTTSPALSGTLLSFNAENNTLFADVRIRMAFAHAIDRDEIAKKAFRGMAKPGSFGILPRDHRWYNSDTPDYAHDTDVAQALLEEAGVTTPMSITLLVSDDGKEVKTGELLKEQLAKVGVEVTVESVEVKMRDERATEGSFETALVSLGSWGLDPDWLRVRYDSRGAADGGGGGSATALMGSPKWYANPEVDRLCEVQLHEMDDGPRKEAVFALQEALAADLPEVSLVNNNYYTAYRAELYDGWTFMFDHPVMEHAKLSYLER